MGLELRDITKEEALIPHDGVTYPCQVLWRITDREREDMGTYWFYPQTMSVGVATDEDSLNSRLMSLHRAVCGIPLMRCVNGVIRGEGTARPSAQPKNAEICYQGL